MRATEFINETLNKETLNPKFKHSIEDNGITYTAKYMKYGGDGKSYFAITATQEVDNQTVRAGEVMFRPKTDGNGNYWLESYMTWVKPDYRKLGVTRMMYAYAKMLGNDIKPSHDQTPRGQAMWQSWKDSGDAEHLMKEEVNPDIRHSEFKHELEIDGLRYTAETDNNSGYGNQLIIKVYDGKKEVANAEFYEEPHDKALISMNTWVISAYQGQNIATNMYAYAKMLGNDIMPSDTQTDQGERMWRSWNQSGQAKHILPKGQKGYREY